MKHFSKTIFRNLLLGLEILLMLTLVLSVLGCEAEEEQETVRDRLWEGTGIPSIGVGRQKQEISDIEQTGEGIVICIDPGHGFDDAGASSTYVTECDERELTLKYAMHLKTELEKMGYTILMTHDGTSFQKTVEDDGNNKFNPYERSAYANSQKIDYFVSLHCDSYNDEDIGGMRIYYCEAAKKTQLYSEDVANAIQASLGTAFPDQNPRVYNMEPSEAYAVIRETYAAGSLIEIGFITNPDDAARILDMEWQKKFVEAVAAGINDYFSALG